MTFRRWCGTLADLDVLADRIDALARREARALPLQIRFAIDASSVFVTGRRLSESVPCADPRRLTGIQLVGRGRSGERHLEIRLDIGDHRFGDGVTLDVFGSDHIHVEGVASDLTDLLRVGGTGQDRRRPGILRILLRESAPARWAFPRVELLPPGRRHKLGRLLDDLARRTSAAIGIAATVAITLAVERLLS